MNTAKAVLNDLVTLGRVRRPALGVRTIPITPELADQMGLAADSGLLIVQVVPAERPTVPACTAAPSALISAISRSW